ncbi:DUF551 domain-containing protein [Cronobacter sakazakii]|nr:DUF551 domain-containing protein [Cronobacter sakazakii]EIX1525374.1 DUF551 domain-containing protein [Cronobacter sakazakii]EIX1533331.1 DUF551 domain-containing protein [Cronobacter sakazakii]EIX1621206.1 DUF551 domain-containing protein [Cronobacter sakazakii]EIX1662428.1 DUF551 domain-containing protein [Cronobacter sakazakii]
MPGYVLLSIELALREKEEPVAWRNDEGPFAVTRFKSVAETWMAKGWKITPLYTAPPAPVVADALEHLRSIVADPRALPRRKEWISGQQYSYVLLENVEAMVDEACCAAMLESPGKPVAAGWIACSDRMPEEGAEVYIFCDGEWVLEAQYREGDFYDVVRDGIEVFETVSRCVSHWQPRPQRPAAPGKEG